MDDNVLAGQVPEDDARELRSAIADPGTPGYAAVRAVTALAADDVRRAGRMTAMGRAFVTETCRAVRERGARALLDAPPTVQERLLDVVTAILRTGTAEVTMRDIEREAGIPHRTVYNAYKKLVLIDACRRRAQMVWRARFELRVLGAQADPRRRVVTVIDVIRGWVGSPEFAGDQRVRILPSFTAEKRDDDLREHLDALARFGTEIGDAAELLQPEQYGAFVATTIEGAAAWHERRSAAYAASLGFVEALVARSALD